MALRECSATSKWMVKPTPQTEWIERRGLLVWIADAFNSIGAGLYLASLFFGSIWGMAIAWLIIVFLKMLPHLIYLGRPAQFWRMLPPFTGTWRTSWIARGMFFSMLFMVFVPVQLAMSYFAPGSGWEVAFKFLGGAAALLVGIYSGFVMSYCRSVPFWNSALLPIVFLLAGLADGAALVMAPGLAGTPVETATAESSGRWLIIVSAIIMIAYLWRAYEVSPTARYSARLLLRGNLASVFWPGVVVCGIVIPLAVSAYSAAGGATVWLLITAIATHTLGAFALKYVILKAGIHHPLLPLKTHLIARAQGLTLKAKANAKIFPAKTLTKGETDVNM